MEGIEIVSETTHISQRKTLTELFIEDFEIQNKPFEKESKVELMKKPSVLFSLYVTDFLICHLVIGPSLVAVWRGIWDTSDIWLEEGICSGNLALANAIAILWGLLICSIIDLQHGRLSEQIGPGKGTAYALARYLFTLVWGSADILFWKGVWDGYAYLTNYEVEMFAVSLVVGLVVLTTTRTVKSSLSSPIGVSVDDTNTHFHCSTFLQTGSEDTIPRRMADVFISRIIETAVILTWYGMWEGTDYASEHFIGLDQTGTALLAFSIGLCGSLVVLLSQLLTLHISQISSNLFIYFIFLPLYSIQVLLLVYLTIISFRGAWYLMDVYSVYLSVDLTTSRLIAMIVGFFILAVLRVSSCLHVGVSFDHPRFGVLVNYHFTSYWYMKSIDESNQQAVSDIELSGESK